MPTLSELVCYPVKSCTGISLREATLSASGLTSHPVRDREWMVVDEDGTFLTQRQHPRMALIAPRVDEALLVLNAPGMTPLRVPIAPSRETGRTMLVRLWQQTIDASDCGDIVAAWLSDAIGTRCRLVHFPPGAKHLSNPRWTGGMEVPNHFSDGYPFLVISQASLDDLNEKLIAQGRDALPMNRFRPNLVIDGIGAFEEDHAREIRIGDAVLKPVKPCPRCPIPSVDQSTGIAGPDPLDILRTYRADPRVDGGITFGMNAILLAGEGTALRVGQDVDIELDF